MSESYEPGQAEDSDEVDPDLHVLLRRLASPDGEEADLDPGPPIEGLVLADRYRVIEALGRGGLGVVYRARDLKLDRDVAVKTLRPKVAADEKARERFDLEARLGASLRSEHATQVLDVGSLPDGSRFLVMEFLRGSDLATLLSDKGPPPVYRVIRWMLQACEVLAEVHAMGIVHRDLKLENLFLAERPDGYQAIKVLDFGLAKTASYAGRKRLTATGARIGTPRSMSPEQIRGDKDIGPGADIWALGTILFELLSGEPPFRAPSTKALFVEIVEGMPPHLGDRSVQLPNGLPDVVAKCMMREPKDRYPSVRHLQAALRYFTRETPAIRRAP